MVELIVPGPLRLHAMALDEPVRFAVTFDAAPPAVTTRAFGFTFRETFSTGLMGMGIAAFPLPLLFELQPSPKRRRAERTIAIRFFLKPTTSQSASNWCSRCNIESPP